MTLNSKLRAGLVSFVAALVALLLVIVGVLQDEDTPPTPSTEPATSVETTEAPPSTGPDTTEVTTTTEATTTTTEPTTSTIPTNPQPTGPTGNWTYRFGDEFNAASLDLSKWSNCWFSPTCGTQNRVSTSPANVTVSGGDLILTLSDAQTGASVSSNPRGGAHVGYEYTYGVVEARIWFPGDGANCYNWPAWWSTGQNWPTTGENDIAEVLAGRMTVNYHSSSGTHNQGTVAGYWCGEYHTYTLNRQPGRSDVYYDGQLVKSYPTDDGGAPQYVLVNVGLNTNSTPMFGAASQVRVDYIRAWVPGTVPPTTSTTTTTEATTSTTTTDAPTTTGTVATTTTVAPTTTLPQPSGFPTIQNTGPRTTPTQTLPRTFTSAAGQVIENVIIEDQLTIRHDNVTVRDVTVYGDRTYMIHVQPKSDGSGCPQNVLIEYTEVDGSNSAPLSYAVRGQGGCGFTFDHSTVINANRGINVTSNATITDSYVEVSDPPADGDHRNGIMTNGGQHLTFTGNTVICTNGACSAAISLFGDFAQIDDVLIEGNLVATSGVYCIRGGAEDHESFPDPTNVRIVGNHFSRSINPNCGTSQPIASHENNVRGNVCHSNVWADTLEPADESC